MAELGGGAARRSSQAWRTLMALFAALALVAGLGSGCGESSGVASGATVTVYVAGAFCAEAKKELANQGGEAGDLHVRAICLPRTEVGKKLKLAQIGANARRATQDSSSIAYIGEPTEAASRFGETILEEAEIAQLPRTTGATAMAEVLKAVEEAGTSGGLRASILSQLG